MGKETFEILKIVILNLKNINFTTIKILFLNDVDIDNIFTSKGICSSENKFKYFVCYLDGYKIQPISKILPK